MKRAASWILPVLAVGLLAGGTAWTLVLAYERGRHVARGSSHRSDEAGARALFLLLQEMGHRPRRWTRPIPPKGTLLVSLEPQSTSGQGDRELLHWIQEGGRLVLAPGDQGKNLLQSLGLSMSDYKHTKKRVWTRWPKQARVARGPGDEPVLLELPYGLGQVLALSEPSWLENKGLPAGDHLELALLLLVGSGRPIYFDEYRHGLREQPGLAYVLARYGLLPAAFAGLLFLGLVVWRTTPAEAEPPPPGDAPGDVRDSLVEARAGLYARSLRIPDALALLEHDLRHGLSAALGEPRPLSWDDLGRKLQARKPVHATRLRGLLADLGRMKAKPPMHLHEVLPLSRRMAAFMKEIR